MTPMLNSNANHAHKEGRNLSNSITARVSSHKSFPGFTLIELIVVITILAILGTIGFLSIQGYSKSARDGTRVSDLAQLSKGLDILVA